MPTRRPFPTDLPDAEWEILWPFVPEAKPGGRPRACPAPGLLNAIFSTCSGEDALGGCFLTISCPGRPPTTTPELGAWTAPGSKYTPSFARGYAAWGVKSLYYSERGDQSTPRRPRPPRGDLAGMTVARRW